MKHKEKIKKILVFSAVIFAVLALAAVFSYKYFHRAIKERQLPKVAIVLDDWGYNRNNLEMLRSIDMPLTLAVLPNLRYSKDIAKESQYKNRQVILHMPMEPKGKFKRLEENTLTADMSQDKIQSVFYKALSSVTTAAGVSNHMGSKFTSDKEGMDKFLKLLKKKKMFFVDNISAKDSICRQIAAKNKVKFAQRNVFLDNFNDVDYIKGQIYKLFKIAKSEGFAVGTGHDRRKTLIAIQQIIPESKDKIRFVFVSELAK